MLRGIASFFYNPFSKPVVPEPPPAPSPLLDLFEELWIEILSHLSPSTLVQVAKTNKFFHRLALSNDIFKQKITTHFPYRTENLSPSQHYYTLFKNNYINRYGHLNPRERLFFTSIKEGDFERIKALDIAEVLLLIYKNDEIKTWIWDSQFLTDYLFEMICYYYHQLDYDQYDRLTGLSCLHWVGILGPSSELILELLPDLIVNANYDRYKLTPLFYAARFGRVNTCHLLLQHGAPIENGFDDEDNEEYGSPFYTAAYHGHIDVVKLLLQFGADVHTTFRNLTALFAAASQGHFDVVAFLLTCGLDPNEINGDSSTALCVAAQHGHAAVVSHLLAAGANPHILYNNSYSPAYVASQNGHIDILKLLLPKINNINHETAQGATCLYVAASNNFIAIIKLLLQHGADPTIRFQNGYTALHVACKEGNVAAAAVLIEHHPELIDIVDHEGYKPLSLASCSIEDVLRELLVNINSDGIHPEVKSQSDQDEDESSTEYLRPL